MDLLLLAGICLFGFFIFLFVWMFRKDEKYLRQLAQQIQSNKTDLREIQEDINTLYTKIDFINRVCTTMKKEFIDIAPKKKTDEVYEKINLKINTDITRLQEEVTSLKTKLDDDYKKIFDNL